MKIETFVFFDFEATGLPEVESNRTKAVEVTFIAVSRKDIENAELGNLPPMKKLTTLFNPQRKMTLSAKTMTGLNDEFLLDKSLFKDKIKLINEFLALPKPVCLVAHSGERLDFPLLRAEYNDAKAVLAYDLLCVDSFKAFKSLYFSGNISLLTRKFSLEHLYKSLVKKLPRVGHRSEDDSIMLLQCVIATKTDFIRWADNNCYKICKVTPLRGS